MNLTGASLYSKATRNMKRRLREPGGTLQPGDIDQQFKLVFIYPMLFDKKLQGKYESTLRNFIAVSMLKEIFVSNALNIVAMASKDYSLTDENGKNTDVGTMVRSYNMGFPGGSQKGYSERTSSPSPPFDNYELQRKIQEKTAIIKKYMVNDPRVKKLNPYVEIITLDNLIDVPVVVGTKAFGIDSLTLAYILTAAIGLKKPIGSAQGWSNIQYVFNVIKNLKNEEAWTLLNNMVEKKKETVKERILNWLDPDHPKIGQAFDKTYRTVAGGIERHITSRIRTIQKFHKKWVDPRVPSRTPLSRKGMPSEKEFFKGDAKGTVYGENPDKPQEVLSPIPRSTFVPQEGMDILKVVKSNLKEAELFFKFMLDDELLRTQFGLERSPGQISTAIKRVSNQANELKDLTVHNFLNYIGGNAEYMIRSFFNILFPHETNIDYPSTKQENLDMNLINNIDEVTEQIFRAVEGTFAEEGLDTNRAKKMKKICAGSLERMLSKIEAKSALLARYAIGTPLFGPEEFARFTDVAMSIGGDFDSIAESVQYQLTTIINNVGPIFSMADYTIQTAVDSFFTAIVTRYGATYANSSLMRNKDSDGNPLMFRKSDISDYINSAMSHTTSMISGLYYVSVAGSVCQYVNYLDVEIETVKNDALDLPNYTLVVPVETIAMIHAAVVAKSWRGLVGEGKEEATDLTDNYVKGIVKFINKRLEIPNLIVIDSQRGQVYYKLQYMTAVNKSNLRTFETYVKNVMQTELETSPY